jgi:cell wall-associated NlpC family hydrolase
MPFVGWLIFLIGTSAAYAAFKGEKLTDVIAHAVNPSAFTANPTLKGSGPTGGVILPPGTQTEGYTPPSNASAGAAAAISYAEAQLGKPYEWGGAGPNAFDCSGLTMQAYAAAGKHLPHFSQAQYVATAGASLPINQGFSFPLGSLVFFGSSIGTIDHVGIVVGPDMMIEAPHTGDVVKYYSISAEGNLVAATYSLGSVSGV